MVKVDCDTTRVWLWLTSADMRHKLSLFGLCTAGLNGCFDVTLLMQRYSMLALTVASTVLFVRVIIVCAR